MKLTTVICLTALLSFSSLGLSAEDSKKSPGKDKKPTELKVGDQAPAFKMTGSDGKDYELKQFKDKKIVVIAWYPKAFTGG